MWYGKQIESLGGRGLENNIVQYFVVLTTCLGYSIRGVRRGDRNNNPYKVTLMSCESYGSVESSCDFKQQCCLLI